MLYECPECGYVEQRAIMISVTTHDRNAICPDCERVRLEMQHVVQLDNRAKTGNYRRYVQKRRRKHV